MESENFIENNEKNERENCYFKNAFSSSEKFVEEGSVLASLENHFSRCFVVIVREEYLEWSHVLKRINSKSKEDERKRTLVV